MSTDATPEILAETGLRDAARAAERAVRQGRPYLAMLALVRLARCYRRHGLLAAANTSLLQALAWSRLTGAVDGTVDLLCDLCELAADIADEHDDDDRTRGRAARDEAREHAREACTLAARVADGKWEIRVLLRVSEVLDRFGDRATVVALQTRALQLMNDCPPARFDLANAPTPRPC